MTKKYLLAAFPLMTLLPALSTPPVQAAPRVYQPKPGSKERTSVLNALRVPVSKFVGKRVTFTHVDIHVSGDWSYVQADTVDSKGKPVGTEITHYVSALLHCTKGRWKVSTWAYATDVISIAWEKEYPRVPKRLWPHNRLQR